MNITVAYEKDHRANIYRGGECVVSNIEIFIDPEMSYMEQQLLAVHGVVENYNLGLPHDKVDQLCGYIEDALIQLEQLNKE